MSGAQSRVDGVVGEGVVGEPPVHRGQLSDEDRRLWEKITQTVSPLATKERSDGTAVPSALGNSRGIASAPVATAVQPERIRSSAKTPPTSSIGSAEETFLSHGVHTNGVGYRPPKREKEAKKEGLPYLEHGASPGVDRRTANRFRKGRMSVERRLDLHGLTQEQAHGALHRFIETAHANGVRCVLVVTGKGAQGNGLLRRRVPQWLNDGCLRRRILSFSHAQISDGGEGALYVLLKRWRKTGD